MGTEQLTEKLGPVIIRANCQLVQFDLKFHKYVQNKVVLLVRGLIHVTTPFNAPAGAHASRAQKGKQRVAMRG